MKNVKKKFFAWACAGFMFTSSVMTCLGATGAEAKEPAEPELTLAEAYEMAVKNSNSLKATDLTADQTWEARDSASKRLETDLDIPADSSIASDSSAALERSYDQTDLSYRSAQKNKEDQLRSLQLDVFSEYIAIEMAKENVRLAEEKVNEAFSAVKVARVKAEVGVLSAPELLVAENNYKNAVNSQNVALESLNKAYVTFNNVVGLWPEDLPQLTDKITFEPLEVDNLEAEVSRATTTSYSIWQLVQNIDLAKQNLRYSTSDYKVDKYDVDIAERQVAAGKKTLEQNVRTMYSEIKTLEEQYSIAEKSLDTAKESYRVAKVQFEAGLATKDDLVKAETTLCEAENSLLNIAYNHELQKASFMILTGRDIIK